MQKEPDDAFIQDETYFIVRLGAGTDYRGVDSLISNFTDDPANLTPDNLAQPIRRFIDLLTQNEFKAPIPRADDHNSTFSDTSLYEMNFVPNQQKTNFSSYYYCGVLCSKVKEPLKQFNTKFMTKNRALMNAIAFLSHARFDVVHSTMSAWIVLQLNISSDKLLSLLTKNELSFEMTRGYTQKILTPDRSRAPNELVLLPIDKEFVFAVDAQENKQQIIDALTQYINSIDPQNFAKDFWISAASRTITREANYYLAKQLKTDLEKPNASIEQVFFDINNKRLLIIDDKKLNLRNDYVERNVDDIDATSSLKLIIDLARNLANKKTSSLSPLS